MYSTSVTGRQSPSDRCAHLAPHRLDVYLAIAELLPVLTDHPHILDTATIYVLPHERSADILE